MSIYFNAAALYAAGMSRPTVEMFRQIYDRTGGNSTVTLNTAEAETLLFELQAKVNQVVALRARMQSLEGLLHDDPYRNTRTLTNRVENLE